MRICLLLTVILTMGLLGCGRKTVAPQPIAAGKSPPVAPLVARWHFVGSGALVGNTNASVLRDILRMPATTEFRERTLQKLAGVPFQLLRPQLSATTNDSSELLRPLLDDLLNAESFAEVRGESDETRELALAVRLTGVHTQLWISNLANVLQTWTGVPVTPSENAGWELKKQHAPNLLRVIRSGDWLVLGAGQHRLALQDEILERIKTTGRPIATGKDYWFTATTDWLRLAQWLALPTVVGPPVGLAEIKVVGEGDCLRVKGSLLATQPLNWKPEPWTIPTNLIREPLISFTAGQGVARWLAQYHKFSELAITPPNQYFVWALARIPFQTFGAVPMKDASNTLARVSSQLIASFKTNASPICGSLLFFPTDRTIRWSGLPFITPFAEAVRDETGEFLFAGLFPNNPNSSPLPAELLARVQGRTNLVYYDWEITQERLLGWRNLSQLTQMIARESLNPTNHPDQQWLLAIGPKLGNSVTEITVASPNNLAFTRKSHIGLTAIELLTLVRWVHSSQFPRSGFPWLLQPANPVIPSLPVP